MQFILSRNNDFETRSKSWMVKYALIFWLVSRIAVMAMMGVCMAVYSRAGINPKELTAFGGDPSVAAGAGNLLRALLITALIAPVFEEILFRYGLSFKRFSVAVSCAFIALFPAFSHNKSAGLAMWLIGLGAAAAVFCAIYFTTSDTLWQKLKQRWQVSAMWVTSIAFGLTHLVAFSSLTWVLLPYALVVISAPFFAGCACAYLRVNVGFGWGVAMHIVNNIPGIIYMIAA